MISPIKTNNLVVTKPYNNLNHNGSDLRSWDFEKNKLLKVQACEESLIKRINTDDYGNQVLVLLGLITGRYYKYIHIDITKNLNEYMIISQGQFLGYSGIGGNSKEHHIHFCVFMRDDLISHLNPEIEFRKNDIKFEYKKDLINV